MKTSVIIVHKGLGGGVLSTKVKLEFILVGFVYIINSFCNC